MRPGEQGTLLHLSVRWEGGVGKSRAVKMPEVGWSSWSPDGKDEAWVPEVTNPGESVNKWQRWD